VGERYRDFSAVTANSLALVGRGIEGQFEEATLQGPVRVVIMNGGGADALGMCDMPLSDCPLILDAAGAVTDLIARMESERVEQVLYAFYPDYQNTALREKLDALRPLVTDACAVSQVPCTFVDLRPTFEGRIAEYTDAGGLFPSALGAEATAQTIWSAMQEQCIAQ
jgi:hypothetical protein